MLKDKKRTLILTSLLTLSPIMFGLLLWDSLPEQMTTHWGADGVADGWSGRPFAVFGLPLIMLATHWLCAFMTAKDPKNRGQNRKVTELVLWIIPVVSLFTSGMVYVTAFDADIPPETLTFGLLGFVFMIIGNYMPKCKQNHTIGIKIKWTLENEENWNATHRMAGKLWVIVGFVSLFCGFLPLHLIPVAMIALISVTVLVPTIYSWNYHKKQVNSGNYTAKPQPKINKKARTFSLIAVSILLVFVGILMFTGDIEVICGETSFTIEAGYWDDLTVEYDAIVRNFTIGKGATYSVDKQLIVEKDVIITVEDGGVLTVDKELLNNGKIIVKKGGTVVVNGGAHLMAYDYNAEGTIMLDGGSLVVMDNAKVLCDLGDGILEANNGATIVNRGLLMVSNTLSMNNSSCLINEPGAWLLVGAKLTKDRGSIDEYTYREIDSTVEDVGYTQLVSNKSKFVDRGKISTADSRKLYHTSIDTNISNDPNKPNSFKPSLDPNFGNGSSRFG